MLLELLLSGSAAYVLRKHYKRKAIKKINATSNAEEHQEIVTSATEKEINVDLVVASASMGLAVLGNIMYEPLRILSIPGWFYVSIPVFEKAFQAIRQKKPDVSIPYTVTNIACFSLGFYGTGNLAAFFYVISRKLLSQLERDSKESIVDVFGHYPKSVWLVVDEVETQVPFEEIKENDIIVVHAGEKIPADGVIIEGTASIDQHILTGEAQPVEKDIGDQVFATTVVLGGKIFIKVEKAGETTIAAQIAQILNQTTHFKTESQLRADTLTQKTIFPTLVAGGLTFPILGPIGATAVMNAHFGYRMSVISSIVMLTYLKVISQSGILLKDAKVLDTLSKVDTIVFDKTGTLTLSKPYVGQIHTTEDWQEDDILTFAAAAEHRQHHPTALAILHEAQVRNLNIPAIEHTVYEIGYGLKVHLDKQTIHVGSQRFMEKEACYISDALAQVETVAQEQGHSVVMIALDKVVIGAIELHPTLRPGVQKAVDLLRKQHHIKEMYILSGDNENPTEKLAQTLGMSGYFAQVLPQEKASVIQTLQDSGKTVCYIGDGINDSIALKKAHVSISLRGASSVATDTAQIVLMNENLEQLVKLFEFAKEFNHTMGNSLNQILVPSVVGATGALLFDFTIIDTLLLKQIGLTISLVNSVRPLAKQR